MTIAPNGSFAYVANTGGNSVSQYMVGMDGMLTPLTPATVTAGDGPTLVTVDPGGNFVYVANADSSDVSSYSIGSGGSLAPLTPATLRTPDLTSGIAFCGWRCPPTTGT